MYKKDLDTYLKTTLPQASLLYGDSVFLIGRYSKKIASLLAPSDSHRYFYYSEYALNDVLPILSQSSLFDDNSVVILKLDKKPSKSDIEAMFNALSHNPNNALIIEFYCSKTRSPSEYASDWKNLSMLFKQAIDIKTIETRFFEPNLYESLEFMREEASTLNLNISKDNLAMLLNIQNNDLPLALSELQKFIILDGEIKSSDITRLCYGLGRVDIEDILSCLFAKKPSFLALEKMLEEGNAEMEFLNEMERYFYQLFLFFAYIRMYGKVDSREILGFSPPKFIEETLSQRAIRIKESGYLEIFKLLGFWRNELMRGQKSVSLRCLIKIQAFIS